MFHQSHCVSVCDRAEMERRHLVKVCIPNDEGRIFKAAGDVSKHELEVGHVLNPTSRGLRDPTPGYE